LRPGDFRGAFGCDYRITTVATATNHKEDTMRTVFDYTTALATIKRLAPEAHQ
jgi:hypothetical protein